MTRLAPLLAAALCLAACARQAPTPRDEIRFAHGPHLAAGAKCITCHGMNVPEGAVAHTATAADGGVPAAPPNATDAATDAEPPKQLDLSAASKGARAVASQQPLPREEHCKQCHTSEAESKCSFCHEHPEVAATYPDRRHEVRFDHLRHADRKMVDCVKCHGVGVAQQSIIAFEPRIPPMRLCTDSCHAEDMPELECGRCHTDLHRYDKRELALVKHPPGFLREHGARARTQDALCGQCHEPTFCSECHLASPNLPLDLLRNMDVAREFVHAADFRARHPSEARLDQQSCLRCHGVQFCDDCHRASGIGGGVGADSPHPPGWLDAFSPNGHARAARTNILTCAGCHESDAERTCVPCHRVGSLAGNPHPPGFGSGMDRLRVGVCRVCHAEGQ